MLKSSNMSTSQYLKNHAGNNYSSPINLNINWCYGSSLLITLVVQILSGLLLATFYAPITSGAFKKVLSINLLVDYGSELRYLHRTNVSLIFIFAYLHIFRALFYGSYSKKKKAWFSGLILFVLIMAAAFTGYVLPWGQRSLWGAIVITNLLSVVPLVGTEAVHWFWGGRSINEVTLYRFYVLHFTIPFIILGLSIIHILLLHDKGSTEPLGLSNEGTNKYSIGLLPAFLSKDLYMVAIAYYSLYTYTVFTPDKLVHAINYEKADNLVTPAHIVPEWYLLPFYGILRSIEDKAMGGLAMLMAFAIFFLLPMLAKNTYIASARFNFIKQVVLYMFAANFIRLGYIGACLPIKETRFIGQICIIQYFGLLFSIFLIDKIQQILYYGDK